MSHLGRALAILAKRAGGQLIIEVPDDLSPAIVNSLVSGANHGLENGKLFALFVHNNRIGVSGPSSVDFRELGEHRQGDNLAITYASDNRGMATYTGVYQPLLSAGFPSRVSSPNANGIANLLDFSDSLAQVLLADGIDLGLSGVDFQKVFSEVVRYLADCYEYAGNGQSSAAADWWNHIESLVAAVCIPVPVGESLGVHRLYGCAGLPVPSAGTALFNSPSDYVEILKSRWDGLENITAELERLKSFPGAAEGVHQLQHIDWAVSLSDTSLRSDSLIRKVALGGTDSQEHRIGGWARLGEKEFFKSFIPAPGKLIVRRSGLEVVKPWADAFPVIAVAASEIVSHEGPKFRANDIEIIVPLRPDAVLSISVDAAQTLASDIKISGTAGSNIEWEAECVEIVEQGVLVRGCLTAQPKKASPNVLRIEAVCSAVAANSCVDKTDTVLTLLWPTERALWVSKALSAKKNKGYGPVFSPDGASEEVVLELPGSGTFQVAIASNNNYSEPSSIGVEFGEVSATVDWGSGGLFARRGSIDVLEDLKVTIGADIVFLIGVESSAESHLSPVVAAAYSDPPNVSTSLRENCWMHLELGLAKNLRAHERGKALGCWLAEDSVFRDEAHVDESGVIYSGRLSKALVQLTPGVPDRELLDHPDYVALGDAYRSLGIPEEIDRIESEHAVDGLTVSRISLHYISKEKITSLQRSYGALLVSSSSMSPTNRFWARNPFSVTVYASGEGMRTAKAVLLSPLHPIRMTWLWELQVGLRHAFSEGADPSASLGIIDGSNFPAYTVIYDQFGTTVPYMPLVVDPRPSDIYLGWHASAAIHDYRPSVPVSVEGRRFPIDGLSALSRDSVLGAITDYQRVAPHAQTLRIELASVNSSIRSAAVDDGVLSKISALAEESLGFDGVSGIKVVDSINRQGTPPSFADIEDELSVAGPQFNVEWVRGGAEGFRPHLTFLEGSTARMSMSTVQPLAGGWIPSVPLRRTPRRMRTNSVIALDYVIQSSPQSSAFERILAEYEGLDGNRFGLKLVPNLADRPRATNWLVTGDFGIDPQALVHAASQTSANGYMLWDWRPTATVKAGANGTSRSQPYYVLATVPGALNNSLEKRLNLLKPGLKASELEERTSRLVTTLAKRAVGLNTLLAIGHHQATGALGFYFSLHMLSRWIQNAPEGEMRVVIPVDAVDTFMRAGSPRATLRSMKRADLLGVVVRGFSDLEPQVSFIPIEIKHYALNHAQETSIFPQTDHAHLKEHIGQLSDYRKALVEILKDYAVGSPSKRGLVGQRLVAVLDAALQLSPIQFPKSIEMLGRVASGTPNVVVGKGLLFWFQAGARTVEDTTYSLVEVNGGEDTDRVEVYVDPAAFDGYFWGDGPSPLDFIVEDALKRSSNVEAPRFEQRDTEFLEMENAVIGSELVSPDIDDGVTDVGDLSNGGRPENQAGQTADDGGHAAVGEFAQSDSNRLSPMVIPAALGAVARPAAQLNRKKISQVELERRYTKLISALREFRVTVDRPRDQVPYREGPAFIEYAVAPAYGVEVNKIKGKLENIKLRMLLPSDAKIGCTTHLGNVLLTVPKDDSERYFIDAEELWARWVKPANGFVVPIGEDVSGEIVELDLSSSNSPHFLIAGATGNGKSEALLTILHGLVKFYLPSQLRLKLIDPKQTELVSLASLPHTDEVIRFTAADAVVLLERAVEEMERRYVLFRQAGPRVRSISEYQTIVGDMPRWVVVLDEYSQLNSDEDNRKKIENCLTQLSQMARAAGIHVILSTQKPVVTVINTVVKANLPGRIALRVSAATDSQVILDESGAEELAGKGDAIVKAGSGKVRVQFAKYDIPS